MRRKVILLCVVWSLNTGAIYENDPCIRERLSVIAGTVAMVGAMGGCMYGLQVWACFGLGAIMDQLYSSNARYLECVGNNPQYYNRGTR